MTTTEQESKILTPIDAVSPKIAKGVLGQSKIPLPDYYEYIRQGPATNLFIKANFKEKEIDTYIDKAIIKNGGLTVFIENYTKNPITFSPTVHRLLDVLKIKAEKNGLSTTVFLPLREYMQMCNLKDEKSAREQVKKDLNFLYSISLSFKSSNNKKIEDFLNVRILQDQGIIRGIITVTFTEKFIGILHEYFPMLYHKEILKFNLKKHPHSYYFARCIHEHLNMNSGKPNQNVMAVKTLLKASPEFPAEEDVKRDQKKRIMEPFYRDLDYIGTELGYQWEYCNPLGKPLTDTQNENLTYKVFKNLYVLIDCVGHPKKLEVISRKKKKIVRKKRLN